MSLVVVAADCSASAVLWCCEAASSRFEVWRWLVLQGWYFEAFTAGGDSGGPEEEQKGRKRAVGQAINTPKQPSLTPNHTKSWCSWGTPNRNHHIPWFPKLQKRHLLLLFGGGGGVVVGGRGCVSTPPNEMPIWCSLVLYHCHPPLAAPLPQ